jgi:hypothetical protein
MVESIAAPVFDCSKAQVLGNVEAPSREAAKATAVRMFNLSPERRSQLVVQER